MEPLTLVVLVLAAYGLVAVARDVSAVSRRRRRARRPIDPSSLTL